MHVAYDVESFPNVFTCAVVPLHAPGHYLYEISKRRNDAFALYKDLTSGFYTRMYGFNNMSFDYPLLHQLCLLIKGWPDISAVHSPVRLAEHLYTFTQKLLATEWGKGWENHIRAGDQLVQQCDLMMLNHFDNHAKRTSLKDLQFNLEAENVAETPIEFGTLLTEEQIPVIIEYNINDTLTTAKFALECKDAIAFRDGLIADGTFGPECINWNDVKIGERFFVNRLEALKPGITRRDKNGHTPGTHRSKIFLGDIIFPYVSFERPELRQLLGTLKETTINGFETKGSYNHRVMLEGVEISIGAGGIHGALDNHTAKSDRDRVVIDVDVTGYYPSIAIVNRLYPEHIGPIFVDVYRSIRDERSEAKKDPKLFTKAGALKLSNNGAFGKTNDIYSPLYDPQCMMAITINGQLLQCVLAEALLRVPGSKLLQLNTDGLTISIPRHQQQLFDDVCMWWQRQTCLDLEFARFDALWLRDCNNYLALTDKGKLKRKGAYDHEMLSGSIGGQKAWNRDFSALVVPKAAEAAFVYDQDPADFIEHHGRTYDFLLRQRVQSHMQLVSGHTGASLGKLVRYYIATSGEPLVKIMPPLKGKTEDRRVALHGDGLAVALGSRKNWQCSLCNRPFANKVDFEDHAKIEHPWPIRTKMQWDGRIDDVDHRWYVMEAEKLLF
jgi:hypothetical protein